MSERLTTTFMSRLKPKDKPYEVRDSSCNGLLVRVQSNGRKWYYFEYDLEPDAAGRRKHVRFNLGQANEAMPPDVARMKATQIMADHHKGEDPAAKRTRAPLGTYIQFLDDIYLPWLRTNLVHGEYAYETLVKAFPEFQELALVEITPGAIEAWRTRKLQEINPKTKKPLNAATINRQLSDLKASLHRARDIWDYEISEKLGKVKPCKIDRSPKVRYLSAEEEKQLRQALDEREDDLRAGTIAYALRKGEFFVCVSPDELKKRTFADHLKPAVLISLNTGPRQGELLKLRENVDLHHAILTVVGTTSKTGKTRHIPLNEEALFVLRSWKRQPGNKSLAGYVFPSIDGKPMGEIGKSWEGLLKRADISNFRWHDLRHTFASKLVMAGENLNTVRELLGHADYKMTLRHAHLAPQHKAAAVAKLCAVGPAVG
ncbi:MAG TPA: site-specific integrase [Candidatus Obscuribacterales bacterium]